MSNRWYAMVRSSQVRFEDSGGASFEFAATGVPANFAMLLTRAAESVMVSSCSLLVIFLKYCSSVKVASRFREPEPGRLKSTRMT